MSWVLDYEGITLVNLDQVQYLAILEVEAGEEEPFCLIARFPGDDDDTVLMYGTEKRCRDALVRIQARIHMVTYG